MKMTSGGATSVNSIAMSITSVTLAFASTVHAQTTPVSSAGRVLAIAGEGSIARSGQRLPLRAGAEIQSGDVLEVGDKSALQVRFTDESIVALRANSQFKIEEYKYDKDAGSDRSIFGLLKGGIRTVTGLIGKANQKNYMVRTATATVGIRGTHFTVVSCNNDCINPDGTPALNGTFGGVTDGRIEVANDGGKQEFSQQDYFYVSDAATAPVRLLAPPAILNDRSLVISSRRPATTTPAVTQELAAGSETATQNSSGTQTSTSPQLTVQAAPVTALVSPLTSVASTLIPALVSPLTNVASTSIPAVVLANSPSSEFDIISSVFVLDSPTTAAVTIGSSALTIAQARLNISEPLLARLFVDAKSLAGEISAIPANTSTKGDYGPVSYSSAADAYWYYIKPPAGASGSALIGEHVAFADARSSFTLPTSGMAQYLYVGGTAPTDNFGRVGTYTSSGTGGLLMDFGAQRVTALSSASVTFSPNSVVPTATIYTIPANTSWSTVEGYQLIPGGVSCVGCASAANFALSSRFVGSGGKGYITSLAMNSYVLTSVNSSLAVNGVALVNVFARK